MPAPGGYDPDAVERLPRPAQERVPLPVAPVLEVDVARVRVGGPEQVHLDRVVDDQVGLDEGFTFEGSPPARAIALRIAARSTTAAPR